MINAIIIDDDRCVEVLHSFLTMYSPNVKVLGSAFSLEKAYKIILQKKPNLVFLEVAILQGNGFDLLRKFSKINFEIIFVSAVENYALEAIKFHPLDYLIKPINPKELVVAIEKVKKVLDEKSNSLKLQKRLEHLQNPNQENQRIYIPTANGKKIIMINEIIQCSSDGSYTWFYLTENRKFLSTKNLGEYEKLLMTLEDTAATKFFRIHHSHLVNLNFISSINKGQNFVVMKNASKIRIAQRRKSNFLDILRNSKLF